MIIVAIANQKGGVGKTTTAVNLSAALAARGRRVLLLDLDSQGNTTDAFGFTNGDARTDGLYNALVGSISIREAILPTRIANLYVLPTDLNLAGAEVEVARTENHLGRLREALQDLRNSPSWDYVLMDCPPSLGIIMTNALAAADYVLIPVQCEYFAIAGLAHISSVMDQIRESGVNPGLDIAGVLLTMFDERLNLNKTVIADVRQHFGDKVFRTLIPRNVKLAEAPSHGLTIFEHAPNSVGALAYSALADEFLERYPPEAEPAPGSPAPSPGPAA